LIVSYKVELDAKRHPVLVKEKENQYSSDFLLSPEDVVKLCNDMLRLKFLAEEYVIMIATDTKYRILGIFTISHGTVDVSVCNPREVFIRALLVGASRIFIIHNHPSGDCSPSGVDLKIAMNLETIGNMMGIEMTDFIIIGGDGFYSSSKNKDIK